jgi:aminoglycoside N3'-acetyltransferase
MDALIEQAAAAGPRPGRQTMLRDLPDLSFELLARQLYFRSPSIYRWRTHRLPSPPVAQRARTDELSDALRRIGVSSGGLVMLHSSVTGVELTRTDDGDATSEPLAVAVQMLGVLDAVLGETGTLVMPTHPRYHDDPGYHFAGDKRDLVLTYDPARTPCTVGLANELFRRTKGAQRSLHPLQSVSARGPLAGALLANNLHRAKPLPHGIESPYNRFCQHQGIIVGLGIPLIEHCTIVHTAEDLRDAEWPVRGFFRERRFVVAPLRNEGEWIVRERKPLFARAYAERQLRRDLLREGILHEGRVGTLRLDWLNAADLLAYLMSRNARGPYPYFLARAAAWGG